MSDEYDNEIHEEFKLVYAENERLRKALQTIADNEIAEYPDVDMIRDFAYAALEGK
jgi:acyl-[acyl carrier protein]--UDP-N-acetylglucosamine O-acyltransferase